MFDAADVADLDHLDADQLRELWVDIHASLVGGYGETLGRAEVAQRLGWDVERVARVESCALRKLRERASAWRGAA